MIDADQLITEACSTTGLDDFGDGAFREGLAVYCESVDAESQLNDIGAVAVPANIVASLTNRLRVVDWATSHPPADGIEAPVIVIGMFRAGTTLLSNLLDQDGANRPLLGWESGDSVPPPTPSDFRAGPRVEARRAGAAMLEQLNPMVPVVHHEEPDGPTECIAVMSQDFKSLSWEAITNVPSYGRWLLSADHTSAYEYHRLVLQVLQQGGVRGRWTLKSPHHAIALDALTAVYPDARLVLLHRDPVALCASVCSLIHTLSSTFSDADHRSYIAEHWTAMLETSVDRIDGFRRAHPDHPIVDVQYDDLVRAPGETVAAIYGAIGEELPAAARAAIDGYASTHGKGRFGDHRYSSTDFGLDDDAVRERFAAYVDRYQIPVGR